MKFHGVDLFCGALKLDSFDKLVADEVHLLVLLDVLRRALCSVLS